MVNEIKSIEDSIDISKLLRKLFLNKSKLFKYTIYSILFGILISLSYPDKFKSESVFVPQLSSKSDVSSSLSRLASQFSFDSSQIGTGNSDISPLIYPRIVESVPFRLELLKSKIIYEEKEISVRQFLLATQTISFLRVLKKYTIGLPSLIISIFKSTSEEVKYIEDFYTVTSEDERLFAMLDKILNIDLNDKDRFVTLTSTYKNKIIPPQITKNAEKILQEKIIEFKSKFSKEQLEFSQKQYKLKKSELNNLQDKIAVFRDQNKNINSSLYQNQLDRLISDGQVLQTVVVQLATQVEQAKLKVNKDTPIFIVIKPVNIPNEKSGPNRSLTVIAFTLLGFVLSSFFIIFEEDFLIFISKIIK